MATEQTMKAMGRWCLPLLGAAILCAASCDFPLNNPYDPIRCASCSAGRVCYNGQCVVRIDAGVADVGPRCGDGIINGGEQCDGSQLGGKTCQTQGFDGGTLKCSGSCTLSLSQCTTTGYVRIAAGTFIMGSGASEPCRNTDEDQHLVTLTHGFEMKMTEVTQAELQAAMGYNPSHFPACGGTCPVEKVNWYEAAAYCNKLSSDKSLAQCYDCSASEASVTCSEASTYTGANIYNCSGYRLPTEAEWEYAYRAGTTTAFHNGANDPTKCSSCSDTRADVIAWYGCAGGGTTHPTGQKQANPWGLYDMAGNVWEWCHDGSNASLGTLAVTDPWGAGGATRVVRGGSWYDFAQGMRAAYRSYFTPTGRSNGIGFRCVRTQLP